MPLGRAMTDCGLYQTRVPVCSVRAERQKVVSETRVCAQNLA